MFAVISSGSKQYMVQKDVVIKVEKISGNINDAIKIDNPVMVSDGKNIFFDKGSVELEILEQKKDKKIVVFKKRRRKDYRRKRGHRQQITVLRVTAINL